MLPHLNGKFIFLPRVTEERHKNAEAMYSWSSDRDSKCLIIIID
jgi:hypothetical protein